MSGESAVTFCPCSDPPEKTVAYVYDSADAKRDPDGNAEGPVVVLSGSNVSSALIPTRTFQPMRTQLARAFGAVLRSIDRYEWRFLPKGSVLVDYDDKPPLLTEEDCIEIHAFGGSA